MSSTCKIAGVGSHRALQYMSAPHFSLSALFAKCETVCMVCSFCMPFSLEHNHPEDRVRFSGTMGRTVTKLFTLFPLTYIAAVDDGLRNRGVLSTRKSLHSGQKAKMFLP